MASGGNCWLQFSKNRGRGRSRDQLIVIFFLSFIKFRLSYHLSFLVDVFNNGVRKMCIKTINDLDLDLTLLEQVPSCLFLPHYA